MTHPLAPPLTTTDRSPTTRGGMSPDVDAGSISIRNHRGEVMLRLDDEGVLHLSSIRELRLDAPEIRLKSECLEVEADRARWSVKTWELSAQRLLERAQDVFRHASALETRARRVRYLVERTLEWSAHRTSIRSEADTRVDGRRVLLG